MLKLLAFLAVLALIWAVRKGAQALELQRREAARTRQIKGESMVACAHCGLHVPASEAVGDGPYFCSNEHRRAGPRDDEPLD